MMSEICSTEGSSVQYFAQVVPGDIGTEGMASRAPGELIEYVFYKPHREKRRDKEIYLERLTPCESSSLFKKKYRL